jgi:hypothetical protein
MLIRNNRKEKAMWTKLTRSKGSLLISLEKASEIITLPKVQIQVHRLFSSTLVGQPVTMALIVGNVLSIQLLKYHNGGEPLSHIQQLTKVCVTNSENTNLNKLQYFPDNLQGRTNDWSTHFETTNLAIAWPVVQQAFILVKCVMKVN